MHVQQLEGELVQPFEQLVERNVDRPVEGSEKSAAEAPARFSGPICA